MEENINLWARPPEKETFKSIFPKTYSTAQEYLTYRGCAIGVGFSYNASTHTFTRHFMRCKKRSCILCEPFWRARHLNRFANREANDNFHNVKRTHFHQVLTTAYKVPKEKVYAAFRYFFQLFRANIGEVEYFCSVEQNRKATQPHFHFLLAFAGDKSFLDYDLIRRYWKQAQKQAKFDVIATQTFTKRLDGDNLGWYILKYITKKDDKAYEIPTKTVWDGRHVRHSRHFYPVAVAAIDLAFQTTLILSDPEKSSYHSYFLLCDYNQAVGSSLEFYKSTLGILQVVKNTWDFQYDRGRANPYCDPTANAFLIPSQPGFLNPMW